MFIHLLDNIDSDEPQVQKSSDTIYISGLGSDKSERELTDKLSERFASIGRIKIDKKTNLPRSRSLFSMFASALYQCESVVQMMSRLTRPFLFRVMNSSYLHGFHNGSTKRRW